MGSFDSTSRRQQTALDYLHGIWLPKKGVAWEPSWQCGTRFVAYNVSKRYNLYKERSTQSPGRKAATLNYGIQVGLSKKSLGNNWLRKTLASANTPPPSRKSLQKTTNIVMTKVEKLNEADMCRRCRQLVDINCLCGSISPYAVPVQCDACTTFV